MHGTLNNNKILCQSLHITQLIQSQIVEYAVFLDNSLKNTVRLEIRKFLFKECMAQCYLHHEDVEALCSRIENICYAKLTLF